MKIKNDNKLSILSSIGNTPLIDVEHPSLDEGQKIYVKMESFNPGGSVKDRPAIFMLDAAMSKLKHKKGVVEATSGNTGIGLALVCGARGIPLTLVMPESANEERKKLLKLLGVRLVLTSAELGMKGAMDKAVELSIEQDMFLTEQFSNPANPLSHFQTTGPEIFNKLGKNIDVFISGIGSGGTIRGIGDYLRRVLDSVLIVAVEPDVAPLISRGVFNSHKITGIGAGFIPENIEGFKFDEFITVSYEEALNTLRELARMGLLAGPSGAANFKAALKFAHKNPDIKNIVTVFPDSAQRYLLGI